MKLFEKLKKSHYRKDPEEHFYAQMIYNLTEYDRLYENQLNQNSEAWASFRNVYELKYKFLENIEEIDLDQDIICIWFFRERADQDSANDLTLVDRVIVNKPNAFFISPSRNIKIHKRTKFFTRRPCAQFFLSKEDYVNIKKMVGIND